MDPGHEHDEEALFGDVDGLAQQRPAGQLDPHPTPQRRRLSAIAFQQQRPSSVLGEGGQLPLEANHQRRRQLNPVHVPTG